MSGIPTFASFFLGEMYLGIEVMRVQEVLPYQTLTPMPLAPAEVAGLVNLRGQIVPAIELRKRLGLPERPAGRLPMNVVVLSNDGPVSLLVDEIGDVVEAPEEAYEPAGDGNDRPAGRLVRGVYKMQRRLLLVLDPDQAVALGSPPGSRAAALATDGQ